jgi:hypothetical protein
MQCQPAEKGIKLQYKASSLSINDVYRGTHDPLLNVSHIALAFTQLNQLAPYFLLLYGADPSSI